MTGERPGAGKVQDARALGVNLEGSGFPQQIHQDDPPAVMLAHGILQLAMIDWLRMANVTGDDSHRLKGAHQFSLHCVDTVKTLVPSFHCVCMQGLCSFRAVVRI